MDQAHEVIITPSGYSVTIKRELNYGEYLEIQRVYGQYVSSDTLELKMAGTASLDAINKAVEVLVVSVEKDSIRSENIMQAINGMSVSDALPVVNRVAEILNQALNPEKKAN